MQVPNLYTGIGVHYYGSAAGQLEYDVVVAPGADLSQVRMQFQGVASMTTDSAGDLVLQTADGNQFVEPAPVLYQTAADAFVTKFNATGSALDYSTFLGGSSNDQGNAIAVNGAGNAYVTGSTGSSNFPTSAEGDGNPDLQLGDLQVAVPLDLDRSPGTSQSGDPALIYNSSTVNVAPDRAGHADHRQRRSAARHHHGHAHLERHRPDAR